jgi:hypothetical protein
MAAERLTAGIKNIKSFMAYRVQHDRTLTIEELRRRYPIAPLGTLTYYGVVEQNVQYFQRTGHSLQPEHRTVVDELLTSLYTGYASELTFQLVVEPTQKPRPYAYVSTNIDLIHRLAEELATYQAEAQACGKRLEVIVRFGSEMNDGPNGTSYADDAEEFISVCRTVRSSFAARAPRVLFPFSPALRADLEISKIDQYWPGDNYVDLVGATWYVHGEKQRKRGLANMRSYYEDFSIKKKPFSLDEFGGAEGTEGVYYDNDAMLKRMFKQIARLGSDGIRFEYGTLFLDTKKYGLDAKLRFLASSGQRP